MKKSLLLVFFLFLSSIYGQTNTSPMVILDAQKMGYMDDLKKEMEELNPNTISTITVYKDSIVTSKYGSKKGVIIITTKRFILETFYKNFIANSPIIEDIPTIESLANIGIFGGNPKSKNQPYDELYKYIDTNTINDTIAKIAEIHFIKPEDAININPEWTNGALEITPE